MDSTPVRHSVVGEVRRLYRSQFGRIESWRLARADRRRFLEELRTAGLGSTRHLEKVLVLVDLGDRVCALHESGALKFAEAERLGRTAGKRQAEVMKQLEGGAPASDFEELQPSQVGVETAIRRITTLVHRLRPALDATPSLLPAERSALGDAIRSLRAVYERSAES